MAETAFSVVYDGPVLETGQMPVRDLAPALFALGEIFATASLTAYPNREPVTLNIKATKEGSFDVHLVALSKEAFDNVVDIFSSDPATALLQLVGFVVGGKVGLFWLIKHVGGQEIEKEEVVPESGNIRLTLPDGTTLEVPAQVLELYRRDDVRRNARQVVEPLEREGIETVKFRTAERTEVVIEQGDVPAYEPPPVPEEVLTDQELVMALEIVSPVFEDGKWKFRDGQNRFTAYIEDAVFIERVRNRLDVFGAGDVLKARVRMTQTQTPTGLRKHYKVVEVLEHVAQPMQMELGPDEPA